MWPPSMHAYMSAAQAKGSEHMYAVDGYFGPRAYSVSEEPEHGARSLISVPLAFPLRASGTAAWIEASALRARAAVHASGGRKGLF